MGEPKTKKKVRIAVAERFGEVLTDMDDAYNCYYLIMQCLKKNQLPVVDFSGVEKLHSYWLTIAIGQYVVKLKEKTNQYIKVYGLNKRNMKILNAVAENAIEYGKAVLDGIDSSSVQEDDDVLG